ncbi:uncharacterized protein LOC113565618 [Drosophila persimilis]|uniref:uncharacterized protein LOC6596348 n=1 Tax=Drosophila persimilis TaxID=7234 RepID=UPI000F083E49|nr:uncharacterized protein LOC6596348 [Drosophila persimilis]XP_026843880.1 uncharacterized protein LOC113565618 [Drosophila persimilis]
MCLETHTHMAVSNHRLHPSDEEYEEYSHMLRGIKTTDDLHRTYKPEEIPPKPTSILRNRQTEVSFNQNDDKAAAECNHNTGKHIKLQPVDVSTIIGPSYSILDLTLNWELRRDVGSTTTIKAVQELYSCKRSLSSSSLEESPQTGVANDKRIASGRSNWLKCSKYSNSECKENKCKAACKRKKACYATVSYADPEQSYAESERNQYYPESQQSQVYPQSEQSQVYPQSEQSQVYPQSQQSQVYPQSEQSQVYPKSEQSQVYPESEQSQVYAKEEKSCSFHESKPNHGSPKLKQNPVYPESQENSYYPESEACHRSPNRVSPKQGSSKFQQNSVYSESKQSRCSAESDRKTDHYNMKSTSTFNTSNGTDYTDESCLRTQAYDRHAQSPRCESSRDSHKFEEEQRMTDCSRQSHKRGTDAASHLGSSNYSCPSPCPIPLVPRTNSSCHGAPTNENSLHGDAMESCGTAKTRGMKRPANSCSGSSMSGTPSAACSLDDGQNENSACNCVDIESFLANCKKHPAQCCDPCEGCCPVFSPPYMRPCAPSCSPPEPPCISNECFCMGYVHDMLEDRSVYAVSYRPVMCCGNNFKHSSNGNSCLCSDLPLGGGCGPCSNVCPPSPCCFSAESPSCCGASCPGVCPPACGGCPVSCLYPLARLSPGYCNSYPCGGCNAYCI